MIDLIQHVIYRTHAVASVASYFDQVNNFDWRNDSMTESLFEVFPDDSRTANQVAYDEKMMFWKDAIRRWCFTNRQASFSIGQMQSNFERNGRLPQCLHTVIEQMIEYLL